MHSENNWWEIWQCDSAAASVDVLIKVSEIFTPVGESSHSIWARSGKNIDVIENINLAAGPQHLLWFPNPNAFFVVFATARIAVNTSGSAYSVLFFGSERANNFPICCPNLLVQAML
jgi:hypothetical protein